MKARILKKLTTPTLIMAWSLYYFIEVSGKPHLAGVFIKPVFWIMVALYVLIVLMDIRDCKDEEKAEAESFASTSEEEKAEILAKEEAAKKDVQRTLVCVGSAVAYILIQPYLGFVLSTTLMLFGLFCWLKAPKKVLAFVLAAAVAVGMYALFKIGLKVPLPTGFIGF